MRAKNSIDYCADYSMIESLCICLQYYSETEIKAMIDVSRMIKDGKIEEDIYSISEEYDKCYKVREKDMIG